MKTNHSPSQLSARSPLIKGVARILIIVGGTFQNLVRHLKAAAADLVLYVDVSSELSSARPRKDVRLLALAPGETLGTLLRGGGGTKALKDLYASRPGINLENGLGQVPVI
ncbi:MAG TPA: hypothetical protein VK639_22990, partial [Terriglobales bacterium]|nr:hypothetical protein [Terriglobales bacterium]